MAYINGEEIVPQKAHWQFSEKGDIQLIRQFIVYTDPGDNETIAVTWPGIPTWFSAHPIYPRASLRNADAERFPAQSKGQFVVSCYYDTKPYSEGDKGSSPADSSHEKDP